MLILWMSSPLFLLQLPLIRSTHIYSRLPEKSGNSCWSTQTSSLPTVFQPLHLNMKFSTTCPQSLVLQFSPKPAIWILESWPLSRRSSSRWRKVWIPESWPLSRRSFSRWRKQVLFDVLLFHGPVLSTWFLNLMVPGDPVVISDASTSPFLTNTICPPLLISLPG